MGALTTRRAATLLPCVLLALTIFASSCASPQPARYRVALIGFSGNQLDEQRNSFVEYGQRRVEAELGAEVEYFPSGTGYSPADLFSTDNGYDLVVSFVQGSSQGMLYARPVD